MNDIGNFVAIIVSVLIAAPLLAIYLYSIVWAYGDAERRGKSGCLVAIVVFLLTWPVGLIIWLLIRPEEKI